MTNDCHNKKTVKKKLMGAILLIAKKRMVSIAVNYLGYALQRKLLLTII